MLRIAVVRSNVGFEQAFRAGVRRQWQPQRIGQTLARTFADSKAVDNKTIPTTPGSSPQTVAGVPTGPISSTVLTTAQSEIPASSTPRVPPTPIDTQSKTPTPASTAGTPVGAGTARIGPTSTPPPPPPKRPRRRFRNFLLSLFILSTLGYAGGVYYSLVSDNFHDFFTEYVPFGEEAVAYFEEREFRKRFPAREAQSSATWPQRRGEQKVTIGKSSGLSPRVSQGEGAGADLGSKGRHTSALEDDKVGAKAAAQAAKQPEPTPQKPKEDKQPEKTKAELTDNRTSTQRKDPEAKTHDQLPKQDQIQFKESKEKAKGAAPSTTPITKELAQQVAPAKPATPPIDHMNVPEASEPVVQDVVKMLNSIITTVNASPDASNFKTTLQTAKEQLDSVIGNIKTLKDKATSDAETQIRNAHTEFDQAAKELVRRLEGEMKDQEVRWRDDYETERERLSTSYQQKLSAELDAANKISDEKRNNELLQQEIKLQKDFMGHVKDQVENERSGRLAKLDQLSSSVSELEQLTSEWNGVVDATLQTQHLQVALEAVRARLQKSDFPTPFLNELVALKEISADNDTVSAAIASINPVAYQRGIPSAAHLIDRFRRVASEVRKASLLPEDAGVASHAASAVLSRMMFQKKSDRGLPPGDDVEATLARSEVLLEEGDLDAAAREMNALKGWAGVLSRDWVAETRRVLEVRQAVDVIAAEARLQSLLIE